MNRDTLIELAGRVEKAGADDQRALLSLACEALMGASRLEYGAAARCLGFIDAGAYESAAMTLVPEGFGCRIWMPNSSSDELPRVTLWGNHRTYAPYDTEATTPALALTAACLRAHASRGES